MPEWLTENLHYLLSMVIAIALGFAIGIERKMRFKEAGIRTHAIVAAGSCLFMLISKYGFKDIDSYDAARIAAQVVSGIGFIGAGMIMYRQQVVHGLTTAAGVWLTAGVGMAVGADMYILAVCATALIIALQCIMHINCRLFKSKHYSQIKVVFINNDNESDVVLKLFEVKQFTSVDAGKKGEDIVYTAMLATEKLFDAKFISETLKNNSFIISISRKDDEA